MDFKCPENSQAGYNEFYCSQDNSTNPENTPSR
jgi:hypothetical protein